MLGTTLCTRKTKMENSSHNFDLSVGIGKQEKSTMWQMLAKGYLSPVLTEARDLFLKVINRSLCVCVCLGGEC